MFTSYLDEYIWKRAYSTHADRFKVFPEHIAKVQNPSNPRDFHNTQNVGGPEDNYAELNQID
jgi:hypothetical protein